MREILFRGRTQDGVWAEGCLCKSVAHLETSHQNVVVDAIEVYDGKSYLNIRFRNVDANTIGQFTGLTDKNGKKIFEGDIVNILNENEETGVIEWAPGEAMFVISSDGWRANFDNYWGKDVEVIGNIHDDPEMLGVEYV